MLAETLNLTELAAQAAYRLERKFGPKKWLSSFLAIEGKEDLNALASELHENESTLSALRRRLERFRRFGFIDAKSGHDAVANVLRYLERGMHVVLEFGRYGDDMAAYILVANLLTRRIHERYVHTTLQVAQDVGHGVVPRLRVDEPEASESLQTPAQRR